MTRARRTHTQRTNEEDEEMKGQGWNHQSVNGEEFGEQRTIESRLNDLKYAVADIAGLADHIHGILFGFGNGCAEPLADQPPSIDNTLRDVERHVRGTAKVLELVYEGLTNAKRLKVNP